MVAVTVTTTPTKLVESNRNRTSLTINNASGNDAIFLLDNMDSNSKAQQLGAVQLNHLIFHRQ